MSTAIALYKISGTDPTKEEYVKICLVKDIGKINNKVKKIISNIYNQMLEDINPNEEKLIDFYEKCLDEINKIDKNDFNLEKLPYNPILEPKIKGRHTINDKNWIADYDNDEKLYKRFNDPENAYLIALDYHTSFDFHYYIEIISYENNEFELTIHNH